MKNIFKNYKQTIILLASLLIGAIIGLIFKEKTTVLSPFGDLFMNLMFVLIIPLIFLTITTSISKINKPKRLGKVLGSIIGVFIITSLVSVLIGFITTNSIKLVDDTNATKITETLSTTEEKLENDYSILDRTVSAISVNDFSKILSKENILALVIFSILIAISINTVGKEAYKFKELLISANSVILKLVDLIFKYYAPIGLGCYFAALIGTLGSSIAVSYLRVFIIYTIVSILYYFIMYSIYAYIAGKKKGLIAFWKNILPATITSISTCSSSASIPINIKCSKNIGVSDDIAETTIPLGTSFHKDGSIIGSVFKIMFLVYLFNTTKSTWFIILVSLIANLLVAAVPVGGGTISEMLIITMMEFPTAALPILTIIATIIDAPATMLNVTGDTASSMLVSRIVDGKNWLKQKKTNS